MTNRIAILGWGSLLWDARQDFDDYHTAWQRLGPSLPIEFSRVSKSRRGALTLVVDSEHGVPTEVSYSFSSRKCLEDAIEDLRSREGTTRKNIGTWIVGECRHKAGSLDEEICKWALSHDVAAVVWTNLASNFCEETGKPFSVANAIAYLGGLEHEAQQVALDYIQNAPSFVQTPLRDAVAGHFN